MPWGKHGPRHVPSTPRAKNSSSGFLARRMCWKKMAPRRTSPAPRVGRRHAKDQREPRVLSQELHFARSDVEDRAVQLDLAGLDLFADGLAVEQELLHASEDVDLDRFGCDGLGSSIAPEVQLRLLDNGAQPDEQAVQERLGADAGLALLRLEEGLRGAFDRPAIRVAEEEDELHTERIDAEFQAASHTALGVGQGVAGVAEHENFPRRRIKEELHRRPGVRAPNDGRHGLLPEGRQRLEPSGGHIPPCLGLPSKEPLVPVDELLQRLVGGHRVVLGRPHAEGVALRREPPGAAQRGAIGAPHGQRVVRHGGQGPRRSGARCADRGGRQAVFVDAGLEGDGKQAGKLRGEEADHRAEIKDLGNLAAVARLGSGSTGPEAGVA
mmetsp:Transcript_116167/g.227866  ORF Transcript_116167/g.227866 Transcript_116167/m.227866 type:complete len:382 (+) Transcript_116167:97-1242(+)